jgi:DNA-binding PadR family transcriptional regulator
MLFHRHFFHEFGRHGHPGFGVFVGRFGGRRGRRVRLRHEILSVLESGPRHGYDIMQELGRRRGGFRPSPGSIYPALAMLEDAGYVRGKEADGKRVYEITDAGRAHLKENVDEDDLEFEEGEGGPHEEFARGAHVLRGLIEAAKQVARLGDERLVRDAVDILDEARRDLYKLLADESK